MKQRKNLKKLLSVIVSAVMMLSVLSIGAMATDSVPTSDVYTIDGNTIYVPKNTFVGDFLKRINSHDSVKKVVDASGEQVNHRTVTDDMKLCIGNTEYDIEYVVLYDMQERIADIEDNTKVFSYSYAADGNKFANTAMASDAMTEIFEGALAGTVTQTDAYLDVYKKTDEAGVPYLEITTNSNRTLHFATGSLGSYANESTYGEYIVTDLDVKNISYSGTSKAASTGFIAMGHYYKGTFNGENDTKVSDDVFGETETTVVDGGAEKTLNNTDFVFLSNSGYLSMGGGGYETLASASTDIVLSDKNTYTAGNPYNVKQYVKIPNPEDRVINVSGLYLNDALQTGYKKYVCYNAKTSFDIPLDNSVTNIEGIARGTLGFGNPRSSKTAFEGVTTVQIYNYSIYLADNLLEETQGNLYINGEKNATDTYGHVSSYSAKTLTNVMPGITAAELVEILTFGNHAYVMPTRNKAALSDNSIINEGDTLQIYNLSDAGAEASRTYTISLANIEAAVTSGETTITASRKCSNLGLGTFVFAAYDENDKLVAAKTTTSADAEGVRSVTFDNSQGDISYVKSFVFNNMVSLRPVTSAN